MKFDDLKGIRSGRPAIIIGKGPSLDKIEKIRRELGHCVIFTCNQAVHAVEALGIQSPLYAVQQDCELECKCVPKLLTTVHLMNELQFPDGDRRLGKMRVSESHYNPKAVLYPGSLCPTTDLTATAAVKIAAHMGIKSVSFFAFDSWEQPDAHHQPELADYAKLFGPSEVSLNRDMGFPRHHSNGLSIRWHAEKLMDQVSVIRLAYDAVEMRTIK